ncbi:hypothetical protein GQ600_10944 [Phytophthora cactorum]|nr:hypothetical protein GQ600_10944 [Phytophthora cactorum]
MKPVTLEMLYLVRLLISRFIKLPPMGPSLSSTGSGTLARPQSPPGSMDPLQLPTLGAILY